MIAWLKRLFRGAKLEPDIDVYSQDGKKVIEGSIHVKLPWPGDSQEQLDKEASDGKRTND